MEHFRQALRANPDAAAELPERSYHRYITGDFPGVVRWLMRYPELLLALEKDARESPTGTFKEKDSKAPGAGRKPSASQEAAEQSAPRRRKTA